MSHYRTPNANRFVSRRGFLAQSGLGLGTMALAHLLSSEGLLAAEGTTPPLGADLRPRAGHRLARAKAVILLLQGGGPSQVDLFDPKPDLQKRDQQKYPGSVESFQPGSHANVLMASPFRFRRHGECGMDFCELLPCLGHTADDWCMVRSMFSDNNNHPQAMRCLLSGKIFPGRPTLGAWVSYALGSEGQNLPAFVVLRDPEGQGIVSQYDNGWLPALYRGTEIQSRGAAVLNLHPHEPMPEGVRQATLEAVAALNEERRKLYPRESELDARIRNYELAARMQLGAERLLDLSREPESIRRLYGLADPATAEYGTRCLMARRLVEAGVRFVQVLNPAASWDHHSNLQQGLTQMCEKVDRPSAALIQDLKQRGLLESTIVMWAGEFGRLPISQGGTGRDHNRHGFTLLLAGGGFKRGHIHGATDEFGYKAVRGAVSCPSLQATLLAQFGLDHARLTYRHSGRDETLTDPPVTAARVVEELFGA
jgi:hypothetical protein